MKRFGLTLFAACLSFSSLVSAFDKPLQRPSVPSYNEIGQTMGFNSRPPIKGGNEASGPFLEGGAQVSFDAEFLYWYSNVTNVVADKLPRGKPRGIESKIVATDQYPLYCLDS